MFEFERVWQNMNKPPRNAESPLLREQIFPLAHFAKIATVRRSYQTLRRWTTVGVRVKNGRMVVLESLRIGSVRHTSHEALRRFLASLNQ